MVWGASIYVNKYMYDSFGNLTTNQTKSIKNLYVISVNKAIP
jgi:hypothetical protein